MATKKTAKKIALSKRPVEVSEESSTPQSGPDNEPNFNRFREIAAGWKLDEHGRWVPQERDLFLLLCAIMGNGYGGQFDLRAFDDWLLKHRPTPSRDALARKRVLLSERRNDPEALWMLLDSLHREACAEENEFSLRPKAERDEKRQEGTKKKRGSRMPKLDRWLKEKVRSGGYSNDFLWASLPAHDTEDLYRDGENVVEISRNGKERATGRDGFDKRVTAARKELSADSK